MLRKPLFWIVIWLIALSLGPITVIRDIPWAQTPLTGAFFTNFIQRIIGTLAFSMLFFQIVLGSLMPQLAEKLGAWVFKFHITEGPIAYVLVLAHPLMYVAYLFFVKSIIDPIYVFLGFCVLCPTISEFYYTLGRLAFWLVSLAVLAAFLRTRSWWQDHWRKFHILNYFVFFLVAIHSFFIGSDTHFAPFVYFWWFAILVVTGISIFKLRFLFRRGVAQGS